MANEAELRATTTGDTPTADGRRAAVAAIMAAVFFAAAGLIESAVIRVFHPTELELDWVSDAILSVALGVAIYLWLHLRATRQALSERERDELLLNAQLSLAESMQRRLLGTAPATSAGLAWAASLTPAGRIGGDFYDFVEPAPGELLVLIADVSGKGIPAAMALSLVRASFRHVSQRTRKPAALAEALSNEFFEEWGGSPYVTALIVHIDANARTLTSTNAGHPAGLFVHDGSDRSLAAGGPPLGLLPGVSFDEETVPLAPGDRCVLVTDGVTESLESDDTPARAWLLARARDGHASARTICDRIMAGALEHQGPRGVTGWTDDRTVIAGIVQAG